jgi:hypothetical protein
MTPPEVGARLIQEEASISSGGTGNQKMGSYVEPFSLVSSIRHDSIVARYVVGRVRLRVASSEVGNEGARSARSVTGRGRRVTVAKGCGSHTRTELVGSHRAELPLARKKAALNLLACLLCRGGVGRRAQTRAKEWIHPQ